MATIQDATMAPTKVELLSRWLPEQDWFVARGTAPRLTRVGGFRLDDPAGEVGIECMFVTDEADGAGTAYHVPMTYRGERTATLDAALIGTSEHSVLGTRWVYDAARDPVAITQIRALVRGRVEAQHQSESDTADPSIVVEGERPDESIGDAKLAIQVIRVLTPNHDSRGRTHVTALRRRERVTVLTANW